MLRLGVAKYFDSVVNEIDLFTETKIQSIKTQTEEDWWNKRRQEQIDEVRRIERACLDHVNTLKVEDEEIESGEWMKRVFVEYCFTVEFDGLLYLAKANRYVEPREKRILDIHLDYGVKTMNILINNQICLVVNILQFEVSLGDNFLTDAPVIDISSGLDKCFCIEAAWVSGNSDTRQRPIYINLEDLIIQDFILRFNIQNVDDEKEAVDMIKCLMTSRDHHINTIDIYLQYSDRLDPSQDMTAMAQSIELNDRVKFDFYKKDSYFQQFDLSGLFEKHKCRSNLFVKVVNWQFISDITFDGVSMEDLEKADLSSLHSLKNLDLQFSSTEKSSSDWMFLDVCRASLERFVIGCSEHKMPLSISCRTFSGMTKLKSLKLSGSISVELDSEEELFADLIQLESLSIHSTTKPFLLCWKMFEKMASLNYLSLTGAFSIQPDNRDQNSTNLDQLKLLSKSANMVPFPLSRKTFFSMTNSQELYLKGAFSIETSNHEESFADLLRVKKLDMSLDEQALATKWFIQSPTLEQLRLSFDRLFRVATTQIRFKLPNLTSLELSFGFNRIDFDIEDMMSCFSHVKKLKIMSNSFDITTKGWFNRLTSVDELELSLRCKCHINSKLFEGFDHLTKLRIYIWPENNLDRCAFNKLVNLETITFVSKNDPLDTEDKSIFNGLNSLRTIEYIYLYPRSRAYVYFENLDRFLLVVT